MRPNTKILITIMFHNLSNQEFDYGKYKIFYMQKIIKILKVMKN